MKNFKDENDSSPGPPFWLHRLAAAWHWLIEPSASIVQPERRHQARLLMGMLLVLLILGLLGSSLSLSGAYAQAGESETVTSVFLWIMLSAVLLLAIAYGFSRSRHYEVAALLAVGTVLGATFVTVVLNPENSQLLFFLVLGGLIGSLFLSARSTALVFFVTLVGLLLLPAIAPGTSTAKNLNALFFILTVGGLVIMAAAFRQRYLEQIDWQKHKLVESEARMRELSIRDSLTGLFNRRYLEEVLAIEMLRAARKQYPIGIIMADIDHFKQFNDIHGHAAGDEVLVRVANFLRAHIRSSDVACRYGGEEFVLILPEAAREITQMRAEQICKDARQLHVQHDGQQLDAVTLSLGVAVFPGHGLTIDSLLAGADTALYRAKHDGRDRVRVAE